MVLRRVLMTADTVGGVWGYALNLASAFAQRGLETHLATMGDLPSDSQRRAAAAIPQLQLHESRFRLEWMNSPWDDVAAAGDWLLALEEQLQPDLVHLNGYAHAALPWHAPHLVVGHSCVYSWWHAVHRTRPPEAYLRYASAVRNGLARARAVVTPSRAMLAELRTHYGAWPHGEVIHNGLPPLTPSSASKEPFVLTVGRLWDEAKNARTAVLAADRIQWPMYMAGQIQHPDGWHADVGRVRHLGFLAPEALAEWYARASIFVAPAYYEPFGLSILEAAMHGAALVLGDIPSLRELWDDAALFVPPHDADALADAIEDLTANASVRAEYGRRALMRASRYTLECCADAYLDLYQRLLKNSSAREAF